MAGQQILPFAGNVILKRPRRATAQSAPHRIRVATLSIPPDLASTSRLICCRPTLTQSRARTP
jgi:hypothetical protein